MWLGILSWQQRLWLAAGSGLMEHLLQMGL
jgi:hypothetical protein